MVNFQYALLDNQEIFILNNDSETVQNNLTPCINRKENRYER